MEEFFQNKKCELTKDFEICENLDALILSGFFRGFCDCNFDPHE